MIIEKIQKYSPDFIRKSVHEHGFFILPNVYEEKFCISAINFIDNYTDPNFLEVNYAGTEQRIWDSQKLDSLLGSFYEDCNNILSSIYKKEYIATTLLAIRNKPLLDGDVESRLNRWHIDSFNHQLKIFLFLTDVSEESGPFEFIPKTHRRLFKFSMLMKGNYFNLSNFLKENKRKYQNLNEGFIQGLLEKEYKVKPVICSAGTMLIVDTSSIHRARPCKAKSRYALTAYF